MKIGTVKWYKPEKDFGFITPDESGGDVFLRPGLRSAETNLKLVEGARVFFNMAFGEGGKASATELVVDDPNNPWRNPSEFPQDGTYAEVLYDDGTTEQEVYWADERYCMLGRPQGSKGPGFMSSECSLPVDPIKWRIQE